MANKITYLMVKELVEKDNEYELLTTEKEFKSSKTLLKAKCKKSHIFTFYYHDWLKGCRCKSCNQYTDEQLINILRDYYKNIGFPTQRKFNSKNKLPSYTLYFKRFGSFKNAILISGIEIPEERKRWFDRKSLSDEEMLKLLKYYTDEKLKNNIYLLTNEDIDKNSNMPHTSTYNTRFGGVINAYKLIGIDYEDFNNKALEKDMIEKYKNLANILGYTPDSRDLDKYSRLNMCYSMNAYENHFGSLYNLQYKIGVVPTRIGRNKTKEDLLSDLLKLYRELGRIPTQRDVDDCDWMASSSIYKKYFNSYENALKICGFTNREINSKIITTKKGTKCYSLYEYKLALILEKYYPDFKKEIYYKDIINNFSKDYRFDFSIIHNDVNYYIEIFGIEGNENYYLKMEDKIKICNENNINLITFYPNELWSTTQNDLYKLLISKINNFYNKEVRINAKKNK